MVVGCDCATVIGCNSDGGTTDVTVDGNLDTEEAVDKISPTPAYSGCEL